MPGHSGVKLLKHYDAIIVGGGQAGSAAAYDLSVAGWKIIILDRVEFPRFKACAGGVTVKTLNKYRYSMAPVIRRTSTAIAVSHAGRRTTELRALGPILALTLRRELDELCLQMALAKGAAFEVIDTIESLHETPDSVRLETRSGQCFSANYLVGADGARGQIRQLSGAFKPDRMAMAIEGIVPHHAIATRPLLTLDFGVVDGGYGWLFPKHDHVNVGVYSKHPDKVMLRKSVLRDYVEKRLGTSVVDRIVGFPIGTGGERYVPRSPRVLLVGDAAGFAESLLGEGIHNAVTSGQAAARALIDSKRSNEPAMIAYRRFVRDIVTDINRCRQIANVFYRSLPASYTLLTLNPVRSLLMSQFAAGQAITRVRQSLRNLAINPDPVTPPSLAGFSGLRDT